MESHDFLITYMPEPADNGGMRHGYIYGLFDPRDGAIRYVGKTSDPKRRLRQYRRNWRKGVRTGTHVRAWFNKLRRLGLTPGFVVLEKCPFANIDDRERAWISFGRRIGWRLCNIAEGGQGGEWCDEHKQRASEATRARYADPDYLARWEEGQAKRWGLSVEGYRARRAERERMKVERAAAAEQRRAQPVDQPEPFGVLTPLTHNGLAFLPLTQSRWAKVDVRDWHHVGSHKWTAQAKRGGWRAKRMVGGQSKLLTHVILGVKGRHDVRFKNGDTLDCRRSNLIKCNRANGLRHGTGMSY